MNEKSSIDALNEAMAGARKEHYERIATAIGSQVHSLRQNLEANNWDLDKVAPYPSALAGKIAYRFAVNYRRWCSKWVEPTYVTRRIDAPATVKMRDNLDARIQREVVEIAKLEFDRYVVKLAGKIGAPVVSAKLSGSFWQYSILDVTCADGTTQQWRTQCIMNHSYLGTLFHQWPTRRLDGAAKTAKNLSATN